MVFFCSVGFFEIESFQCAYQNSDAHSMFIYQAAFGVISLTAGIGLCSALEDAAAVGMATVHFCVCMCTCALPGSVPSDTASHVQQKVVSH